MQPLTISEQVKALLQRASEDARRRRHGAVTVEHALRALLAEPAGARLLRAVGADPLRLIEGLEGHLSALPKRRWFQPEAGPDWALLSVCERAATAALSAGRPELRPGDLLAALYGGPREGPTRESTALALLESQGVRRLHLLRYLCHGLGVAEAEARRSRAELPDGGPRRVVLLNDDYTPMDFVVLVLQTIFDKPEEEARRLTRLVHERGRGPCGVYPGDVAVNKAADVLELAEGAGFPLLCELEPA